MIGALLMLTLAGCIDQHVYCGCPSSWAVIGEVTTNADGGTVISGGTVFGPAPAEVRVSSPPGTKLLVSDSLEGFGQLGINSDGTTVSCANVTVDALAYAPTMIDGTCGAALEKAGFKQPRCNDTGFPFCGCTSGVAPLSLALIAIVIRSMKRRRADL